jgi:hypothetical protein
MRGVKLSNANEREEEEGSLTKLELICYWIAGQSAYIPYKVRQGLLDKLILQRISQG